MVGLVLKPEGGQPYETALVEQALNTPEAVQQALASCHSLAFLQGLLVGDPLDRQLFVASGWEMSQVSPGVPQYCHLHSPPPPPSPSYTILLGSLSLLSRLNSSAKSRTRAVLHLSQPSRGLVLGIVSTVNTLQLGCLPSDFPSILMHLPQPRGCGQIFPALFGPNKAQDATLKKKGWLMQ